jgi:hypothetical protein
MGEWQYQALQQRRVDERMRGVSNGEVGATYY